MKMKPIEKVYHIPEPERRQPQQEPVKLPEVKPEPVKEKEAVPA